MQQKDHPQTSLSWSVLVTLLTVALVRLVMPVAAQAASYYIDCAATTGSGTGDNGPGTQANPWKSIQKVAQSTFVAGDSILFKRGCSWDTGFQWGGVTENVGLTIDSSGTAQAKIVYGAYGADNLGLPKFYNSYSSMPYVYVFNVTGDHNILENFEITGAKELGIAIRAGADNNVIRGMDIYGLPFGIKLLGNNNLIENNKIHDLVMHVYTPSPDWDDAGAVGIIISSSYNEIRQNQIWNAVQKSYDFGVDGGAIEFFGNTEGPQQLGNTIHHNFFRDNAVVFETGSTNNAQIKDNVFAYNVLINNGAVGVFNVGGGFAAQNDNMQMYNNTIFENETQYTFASDRPDHTFFSFWAGSNSATTSYVPPSSMLKLYNNIFFGVGVPKFSTHPQFTREYNLIYMNSPIGFDLTGSTNLSGDPFFVNALSHDFHLTTNSPALNSGSNAYLSFLASKNVTTDHDGTALPLTGTNAPIDRGAYEFVSTINTPSPSPSSSPTPVVTPTPVVSPTACQQADINQDGTVNLLDYTVLIANFFSPNPNPVRADINQDGTVNLLDFTLLAGQFFETC